jgi:hypothetical protein
MPVRMSCIDPRAFALHKLWLSRRADRTVTIAALVLAYLKLSFGSWHLKQRRWRRLELEDNPTLQHEE